MRPRVRPHLRRGCWRSSTRRQDPVERIRGALLAFAPPQVDFLLPHGNWSNPPPGLIATGRTPYGDWLAAAFDRWFHVPRQETVVRLFRDTVVLLLGGRATTTHSGSRRSGSWWSTPTGPSSRTTACAPRGPAGCGTGLDVHVDSVDDVLAHPAVRRRQSGSAALADDCRRCRLLGACGGGNYAHRYRDGTGFRNRSVYCADLQRYIEHVRAAVRAGVAGR